MAYDCKVVADSISPAGDRLTTLVVTAPPDVLDKIGRCRELYVSFLEEAKPTPLVTAMQQAKEDPVVPVWPHGPFNVPLEALPGWLEARDNAVQSAYWLSSRGIPNAIAKRLLAPFLWEQAVVSGTDWNGVIRGAMRSAEVEIAVGVMFEAMRRSEPARCEYGQWHEPHFEGHAARATDSPCDGIFKGWWQAPPATR